MAVVDLGKYALGWSDDVEYVFTPEKGPSEKVLRDMSAMKGEPDWMLNFRLKALKHFNRRPMPHWGPDLSGLDFNDIYYYLKPTEKSVDVWDELPPAVRDTYEKLGIPEAERKYLAGVTSQYDSEVVYHRNREDLAGLGILFTDMDTALREHPEIVKKWMGKIIPPNDNKFAALNSAFWSGGSFIYVPPGVHVPMPLQAYFRINSQSSGQFERTLIVVDEGASVHYIEGCSAPTYTTDALHSAVVELVALPGARITYTTVQNWSNNVYNLVTKRAMAHAESHVEWIDGNIGCIAQGMRVTTPSGPKPIELVEPGEQVLSFDEEAGELCWREVIAKKDSGYQAVMPVSVGERSIWVTGNHPFYSYVYDKTRPQKLGRYELAYVRADEVSRVITPTTSLDYGEPYKLHQPLVSSEFIGGNQWGGRHVSSRPRQSRLSEITEVTSDDIMWLFGLFVADGSIDSKKANNGRLRWAKVQFSVPTTDRAYSRLLEVMNKVMPNTEPTVRKDNVLSYWNSVELAEWFIENGFTTGARHKVVPPWILGLPESERLSFLVGYMEGDGTISVDAREYSVKSVSEPLINGICELLTTLGIHSRKHHERPSRKQLVHRSVTNATTSFRAVWTLDERLVSHLSSFWQKKLSTVSPRQNISFRKVGRSNIELPSSVDIRPCKTEASRPQAKTWDIEVEGTGNFVCEGFIVHNSQVTQKYPAVWLVGPKASGEVLSVAYAGAGQHQDTGAKMVHAAPETTSKIVSKSISKDGGRTSYRGLVRIEDDAYGCKSHVQCDALILDEDSTSDTYPYMEVGARDANVGHEATVSKVADEQLFYLRSRGLTEEQAMGMIVNGFIEPVTRTLPMEYAVEWSRLIELQMEGSIG